MRTTIDAAGRIVVPKALREAAGLSGGGHVDISLVDGRLEIEVPPVEAALDRSERLPRLVAPEGQPPVTDAHVRSALDDVRR